MQHEIVKESANSKESKGFCTETGRVDGDTYNESEGGILITKVRVLYSYTMMEADQLSSLIGCIFYDRRTAQRTLSRQKCATLLINLECLFIHEYMEGFRSCQARMIPGPCKPVLHTLTMFCFYQQCSISLEPYAWSRYAFYCLQRTSSCFPT